jgi:2-oxoisovalerate dehydrogenase E1 component
MKATLEALTEEMAHNPKIFVMGEGIGVRGGNFATTSGLFEVHGPERLRDTPICERGFVGLAGGAAMTGTRPVVDFMFADFVLDSVGEIINQIAKMQYMSSGRLKMPVLMRGCIGIGHAAATHHSGSYYSMYAHFPGLRVVVPSSPRDAKGLLNAALEDPNPYLYFEHKMLYRSISGPVPDSYYTVEVGKAALAATGTQASIITYGMGVHWATKAVEELGISADILDLRTLLPWDKEAVAATVKKTGKVIFLQEDTLTGGIGAEICAWISEHCFADLDAPVMREGSLDTPVPFAPNLEKQFLPVDRFKVKLQELIAY